MTQFFFDIDDGLSHFTDDQGVHLSNHQEAYSEAKRALLELVAEMQPIAGQRCFKCLVRNDQDISVYLLKVVIEEAFSYDGNTEWRRR